MEQTQREQQGPAAVEETAVMEEEVVCGCSQCEHAKNNPIEISGNNRVLDFMKFLSKKVRRATADEVGETKEE